MNRDDISQFDSRISNLDDKGVEPDVVVETIFPVQWWILQDVRVHALVEESRSFPHNNLGLSAHHISEMIDMANIDDIFQDEKASPVASQTS